MKRQGIFLAIAFTMVAWIHPGTALATIQSGSSGNASVLVSESVLLQESGATTTSLAIPGPGELFVTVTDLQFPTSFSSLQYAVSSAAGAMATLTSAGTITSLDLTTPTTLYANVFATVGQSGAGLYNLTATFVSAVPLPGSFGVFASAGILLALLGHHRKSGRRLPRAIGIQACDCAGTVAAAA